MSSAHRIVIVGGGICGLATALAVARRGHAAVVLEKADRFAEIGAGIQIAPNGIHALRELGLDATTSPITSLMDELRFMDGVTGEHVASMALTDEYQKRFGYPYVVVHRAQLHAELLAACQESELIDLRTNAAVTGYRITGYGAVAMLRDCETVAGAAVIGADGIHSAIRRQLVHDGDPIVSGITIYRTTAPMETVPADLLLPASVTAWAGPKWHLVHYPIAGGRLLNLAISLDNGATERYAGVPVAADEVLAQFPQACDQVARLLALGEDWKTWMLVDREPVQRWTDGPVVLLGDAAHPTLHYAAQGACQAIEDAVLLGRLLDGCAPEDFAARFAELSKLRRDRTARVHDFAHRTIEVWHPAGDAARERNRKLSGLTGHHMREFISWMHSPQSSSLDGYEYQAPLAVHS
ncbi:FAD-dependent monooxygenase [Actinospica sp. MGRD01-02]|uniref:FAD-dependent monooxygenase n=1 Tax=Actinospica acidithermotolerans TaxID=2828514 RepID=A0A941EG11_9ACTN|nr:FAD-dependent monooxygenase [Actinospica acidithermotolerans]MBR7829822.1 FAD-dependent monooxygenase [Actinospica acidithermotolerans]